MGTKNQRGMLMANRYQKRQAACTCLAAERREYIKDAMLIAHDFNDGAFMAYMEERGIDVSELEAFSKEHDCVDPKAREAKHGE
jgi:hypothetical protein